MSEKQEYKMLSEIREMMAMDKSAIAEKYHCGIDSAEDYRATKAMATLDVVLDSLNEIIQRSENR